MIDINLNINEVLGGFILEIKDLLCEAIRKAAQQAIADGALPEGELPEINLEVPPQKEYGDFATNIAMQSARVFHKAPRQIAEAIAERLENGDNSWLDHTQIAGPGFLNVYLKGNVLYDDFAKILAAGESFGQLPRKDAPKIQVEYVSANPTGPLHVGHGRGAAAGSALVNILRAAGYPVESEYYINDAGNQMDNLALSVNARYLEHFGVAVEFPENGYHGADIIDTAERIIKKDGDKYLKMEEAERLEIFKDLAYLEKLAALKEDLEAFQVTFDKWFSERTLHPEAVKAAVKILHLPKNGQCIFLCGGPGTLGADIDRTDRPLCPRERVSHRRFRVLRFKGAFLFSDGEGKVVELRLGIHLRDGIALGVLAVRDRAHLVDIVHDLYLFLAVVFVNIENAVLHIVRNCYVMSNG